MQKQTTKKIKAGLRKNAWVRLWPRMNFVKGHSKGMVLTVEALDETRFGCEQHAKIWE